MSLATFLPTNLVLEATFSQSVGTANVQFPLVNMAHDFSTKVYRSNESSASIIIDLQQIEQVDFIAIRGNFIDGLGFNTAQIEGSSTLVFSGTPTPLNISHKHTLAFVELPAIQSYRYWKLDLTGNTYVEVANLFIGKKVQMEDNNVALGFSYVENSLSTVYKNSYGQRFIDTYGSQKVLQGDINYCNDLEFNQLNDIQIQNGEEIPLWFFLDVKGDMGVDSEYLYAGMFYMKDLVWKQVAPGLFNTNLLLEECL